MRWDMVGGDTSSSPAGLYISITAVGIAPKHLITLRSTANESDIICVSGDLGGAYAGLQVLEREKQKFQVNPEMQPQLDNYTYVVGRQLHPKARMDMIHKLRNLEVVPTSMIDVSDGLASEALHLCRQSGLGVAIYEDKLPIDKETYETATEFSIDPKSYVLNGGEDYELLFTISQSEFEKIKNHTDIHIIGHMQSIAKGEILITKNQNAIPLMAQGWKHF